MCAVIAISADVSIGGSGVDVVVAVVIHDDDDKSLDGSYVIHLFILSLVLLVVNDLFIDWVMVGSDQKRSIYRF